MPLYNFDYIWNRSNCTDIITVPGIITNADYAQYEISSKFTSPKNTTCEFSDNTLSTNMYTSEQKSDAIGNARKLENDAVVMIPKNEEETTEEVTLIQPTTVNNVEEDNGDKDNYNEG